MLFKPIKYTGSSLPNKFLLEDSQDVCHSFRKPSPGSWRKRVLSVCEIQWGVLWSVQGTGCNLGRSCDLTTPATEQKQQLISASRLHQKLLNKVKVGVICTLMFGALLQILPPSVWPDSSEPSASSERSSAHAVKSCAFMLFYHLPVTCHPCPLTMTEATKYGDCLKCVKLYFMCLK